MKNLICILLVIFISIAQFAGGQTVSTLAGSTQGFLNGASANAQFNYPNALCVDSNGNVFVADIHNHVIRKISSQWVVTTFAGSSQGYADGIGSTAQFNKPNGICIDKDGNLYVSDLDNFKIRKITSTGIVSTVAGSSQGNTDGIGIAAQFDSPTGICVDTNGNLYVADLGNNTIRKISQSQNVSTLAGSTQGFLDGNGIGARFYWPSAVCVDLVGNLFVTDRGNNKIRKITPSGLVTTIAGSSQGYTDGIGTIAKFDFPTGICIDVAGDLYVCDQLNNRIRKVTQNGIVSTLVGSSYGYLDGLFTSALLGWPKGVAIDDTGNVYVADGGNYKIRKINQCIVSVATTVSNSTISAIQNGAMYQWLECADNITIIPNATGQSYTGSIGGSYAVIVSNGTCVDTSECRPIYPLGIEQLEQSNAVSVFPNPNNGLFTLKIQEDAQLEVKDIYSRLVMKMILLIGDHKLDISSLSNGLYFLNVQDINSQQVIRLLKGN